MAKTSIGYETTYIVRSDLNDDGRKSFLEKVKSIIQEHGGQVLAVEDWGRRKLAYPIKKDTRGYYTYVLYTGDNSLVQELERNLRLNEQVLRFLTVKLANEFDSTKFKYRPTANNQSSERETVHV